MNWRVPLERVKTQLFTQAEIAQPGLAGRLLVSIRPYRCFWVSVGRPGCGDTESNAFRVTRSAWNVPCSIRTRAFWLKSQNESAFFRGSYCRMGLPRGLHVLAGTCDELVSQFHDCAHLLRVPGHAFLTERAAF